VAEALRAAGVLLLELTAAQFGGISFKENLQGIGAVVRPRLQTLADVVPDRRSLGWVALATVGNPGNLGAILRTCDAVGCAGIILLGETTDPYHPSAVRASMGAVFSQRLVRAELAAFGRWARDQGWVVAGTSPAAGVEYRQAVYPRPVVLLMGSERLGLSPEQQALCDLLVRIPMIGTGDSLNLAVATGVVLYEVFHQHRAGETAAR
jgi:TrmH family RNA methyltransferase